MNRNYASVQAFCLAIAISVCGSRGAPAAVCTETLAPTRTRALPLPRFDGTQSIAWGTNGRLLLGTHGGIVSYDPASDRASPFVPGEPIPSGLPDVAGLDADGKTVVAFNLDYSDLTADATSGEIESARRQPMLQIADVAVRGRVAAVLGFPVRLRGTDFAQLWLGEPGAPWDSYTPLHPVDPKVESIVRNAIAPYGGAVTFESGSVIAMISPAEAGVFRYKIDGTPLAVLGSELRELVVPRMQEAVRGHARDLAGRYREIFDRQPTIDDLVATPAGLAIVVRVVTAGSVGWQLWYPDAHRLRRISRLQLGPIRSAGTHLHCSVNGATLACVYGDVRDPKRPPVPMLAMFPLAPRNRSSCR